MHASLQALRLPRRQKSIVLFMIPAVARDKRAAESIFSKLSWAKSGPNAVSSFSNMVNALVRELPGFATNLFAAAGSLWE